MKHPLTYHNVPRETFQSVEKLYRTNSETLNTYIDQLLWWNDRINLVSRDVPRETLVNHIKHSLLLTQFSVFKEADQVIDAGTGGGLPGFPLAIANNRKKIILNDIVTKKIMAVKQMARKQQLFNIDTFDQSIEQLTVTTPSLLISKHAFKINDLIKLTSSLPLTEIVLYKGLPFKNELTDIDESLQISVHQLSQNGKNDFYKEKALLIIKR